MSRLSVLVLLATIGACVGAYVGGAGFELVFPPNSTADEKFEDNRGAAVMGGLALGGITGTAIAEFLMRHRRKDEGEEHLREFPNDPRS